MYSNTCDMFTNMFIHFFANTSTNAFTNIFWRAQQDRIATIRGAACARKGVRKGVRKAVQEHVRKHVVSIYGPTVAPKNDSPKGFQKE